MSPPTQRNDEELAKSCQSGEVEAFDELVKRYWRRIQRFVMSSFDQASAEDVAQEVLIRAYRKIHLFDTRRSFAPWLFVIARRVAHDAKKRQIRRAETGLGDEFPNQSSEPETSPIVEPLWELAGKVLKEESYQAMRLHYAEDLSIREIAGIMNKTETGLKVTLFRARRRLRQKAEALELFR